MSYTLAQLDRALRKEVAAEAAVEVAEAERRSTWWESTWLLAACPRDEWSTAKERYVQRTGHAAGTGVTRRRIGTMFSREHLALFLPAPRFAEAAGSALGAGRGRTAMPRPEDVGAMVELLAEAEREKMSLREFSQALTGRPWTRAAENMTTDDEDAVIDRALRTRPEAVGTRVGRNPRASRAAANATVDEELARRRATVRQRQAADNARLQGAIEEGRTAREQHDIVEHEAEQHTAAAEAWMRRAAQEYERNPDLTPAQRARQNVRLDHIERLIALLRGEPVGWTAEDHKFMSSMGVEL